MNREILEQVLKILEGTAQKSQKDRDRPSAAEILGFTTAVGLVVGTPLGRKDRERIAATAILLADGMAAHLGISSATVADCGVSYALGMLTDLGKSRSGAAMELSNGVSALHGVKRLGPPGKGLLPDLLPEPVRENLMKEIAKQEKQVDGDGPRTGCNCPSCTLKRAHAEVSKAP